MVWVETDAFSVLKQGIYSKITHSKLSGGNSRKSSRLISLLYPIIIVCQPKHMSNMKIAVENLGAANPLSVLLPPPSPSLFLHVTHCIHTIIPQYSQHDK